MLKYPFAIAIVFAISASAHPQDGTAPVDMVKFAERTAAKAAELLRSDKANDEVVASLVRMVLGRQPTDNERKVCTEFLTKKNREDAGRDILWALMNSKEFMKNMNITDLKEIEEMTKVLEKSWPKKKE